MAPPSTRTLQAQASFPELARAADAVRRTFRILDAHPAVDPSASVGAQVELEGGVELRRVAFAYPSRPQRLILKEFSLAIPAGTSCALVGGPRLAGQAGQVAGILLSSQARGRPSVPALWSCQPRVADLVCFVPQVGESGHGKSTIISLLERFYDPLDGQVLVDGIPVASLSLACLRRQLALVGQEPVVFR